MLKNLETPEGQRGKQRKLGKRKSSLVSVSSDEEKVKVPEMKIIIFLKVA